MPKERDFLLEMVLLSTSRGSIVASSATRSLSDGVELDGDEELIEGEKDVMDNEVDVEDGVTVVAINGGDEVKVSSTSIVSGSIL